MADWLQGALSGLAPLAGVIRAVSVWFPQPWETQVPSAWDVRQVLCSEVGGTRAVGFAGWMVLQQKPPQLHPNTHRVPGSSKPNNKLGSVWLACLP